MSIDFLKRQPDYSQMASDFANPPAVFRPFPFWSLNDTLEPDEMARQMQEMGQKGLGGAFLHARTGLETPYMSEEWMECLLAAVKQAEQDGTYAWLYDENGWPSGFAGGELLHCGEEYLQKYLCSKVIAEYSKCLQHPRLIGLYEATDQGYRMLESPDEFSNDKELLCISYDVNPTYIDTLDEAVVAHFTHLITLTSLHITLYYW